MQLTIVAVAILIAAGTATWCLSGGAVANTTTTNMDTADTEHQLIAQDGRSARSRKRHQEARWQEGKKYRAAAKEQLTQERERVHNLMEQTVEDCNMQQEVTRPQRRKALGSLRVPQWTAGCRTKLYRQQRLTKQSNSGAGKAITCLLMMTSILHQAQSSIEVAGLTLTVTMVLASMVATALSSAFGLLQQVHGNQALSHGATQMVRRKVEKWSMGCRSLVHVAPSTWLCWRSVPLSTNATGALMATTACASIAIVWVAIGASAAVSTTTVKAYTTWTNHWEGVYAYSKVRAQFTAAHVYLDTLTPSGSKREKYIVDLGAAASVIPMSAFTRVCLSCNLALSSMRLKGASGHELPVEGSGELQFLLPHTETPVKHRLQVTANKGMAANLRILGIDFWYKLKSEVNMVTRMISGTTPAGEPFRIQFHIAHSQDTLAIAAIKASQMQQTTSEWGDEDMILHENIQLQPGQVVEFSSVLPEHISHQLRWSWWKSWSGIGQIQQLVWEASEYTITTSDEIDAVPEQLMPTSTALLSIEWSKGQAVIKQYAHLPAEIQEEVTLPAGSVIGRVSLVNLATMDDKAIQQVLKAGAAESAALKIRLSTQEAERQAMQEYVGSIMAREGDRSMEEKQTTVRHKPQTQLPGHDIRGTKTGKQLVQIWKRAMRMNPAIADEYQQWIKKGVGSKIEFGKKKTDVSRGRRTASAVLRIQRHLLRKPKGATSD